MELLPYRPFCWRLILYSIREIVFNHRERFWGPQESPPPGLYDDEDLWGCQEERLRRVILTVVSRIVNEKGYQSQAFLGGLLIFK